MSDDLLYGANGSTPPLAVSQRTRNVSGALHVPYVIDIRAATGTVTRPAVDVAASATILASNAARLGATVFNDTAAALYVKCGATASSTSFIVKMAPGSYWEMPFCYTGIVDAIPASGTGNVLVTEFTY